MQRQGNGFGFTLAQIKVVFEFRDETPILCGNTANARLVQSSLNDQPIQRLLATAALLDDSWGNRYRQIDACKKQIENLHFGDQDQRRRVKYDHYDKIL